MGQRPLGAKRVNVRIGPCRPDVNLRPGKTAAGIALSADATRPSGRALALPLQALGQACKALPLW